MARGDNAYSRWVGLLKVGLPLAALALLSMLFMVARTLNPEDALPYANVDIDELLSDPRLTSPTFSGMTAQGDEIGFTAEAAHPQSSSTDGARAIRPELRLVRPTGEQTTVRAAEGHIEPSNGLLVLSGDVVIETSGGYRLQTQLLNAATDRSRLESPDPVQATAPQTEITADSMILSRENPQAAEVLVFKGGVRLIYQPPDSPQTP